MSSRLYKAMSEDSWQRWIGLFLVSPIALTLGLVVVALTTESDGTLQENIHLGVWTTTAILAVVVSGVLFTRAVSAYWFTRHDVEADDSECLVTLQNLILTGSLFGVHLTFAVVAMVSVTAPEDHWLADQIIVIGLVVGQYGLLVGGMAAVLVNQRLREVVAREVEEDVKVAVEASRTQMLEIGDEARGDRRDLEAKIDALAEYLKQKLG